MSAVAPLLKPFGLGSSDQPASRRSTRSRPRLVIVAAPARRAGRVPFAILIGAILVTGLVTLLMLHTMAAQDGFKVSALQEQQKSLNDQLQSLEQTVQADAAPSTLREKAAALGMLPSVVNSYRHLPDGRVVGLETPVYPVVPVVTTPDSTTKKPAATDQSNANQANTGQTAAGTAATTTGTAATTGGTTTSAKAGKHHAGTGTTTTTPTTTGATSTTKTGDGTAATTNQTARPGHPHR